MNIICGFHLHLLLRTDVTVFDEIHRSIFNLSNKKHFSNILRNLNTSKLRLRGYKSYH